MSSVSDDAQYEFEIDTSNGSNTDHSGFTCYSSNGMSDTLASQIVEALRGITPPAGTTIQCTVTKSSLVATSYTTDYATNPLSFT